MSTYPPPLLAKPPKDYLSDPEFHSKPFEERIATLEKEDAEFAALPPKAKVKVLLDAKGRLDSNLGQDFSGVKGGASTVSVKGSYDKPIFTAPVPDTPGNRGYREQSLGVPPGPTMPGVTPRDVVNQLPNVAAAVATAFLSPAAGFSVRTLTAAGAGGASSLAVQGGEKVADVPPSPPSIGERYLLGASNAEPASPLAKATLEAITQGVFEIPGAMFKLAAGKIGSRLPSTAEELLKERAANELGMDLTTSEIKPILSDKEKKLKEIAEKTIAGIDAKFGEKPSLHNAGEAIYSATKNARSIAGKLSSANYKELAGLTVDLQPHADTILSIPPSLLPPELAAAVKGIAELKANRFPPAMVKKAEQEAFGTIPFQTVQELRTAVREASDLPPKDVLTANISIGLLKNANKKLTTILDEAAAAGGKSAEWKTAREYHRTITDTFGPNGLGGQISATGIKDPQQIVALIAPNDMKAVRDMKQIFKYTEEGGDASAKLLAKQAERQFQRAFLSQKILDYPVEQWQARMKYAGRDVIAEILGNNEAEALLHSNATLAAQLTPESQLLIDAVVAGSMKGIPIPASFGTRKNILKDLLNHSAFKISTAKKLKTALEVGATAAPNTARYLSAVRSLASMIKEIQQESPPELLKKQEDATAAPFLPADPGVAPTYLRR